jgi:hypothetical protein
LAVTEQVHWPFVSVQEDVAQPRAPKMVPAFSHETGTDEIVRQAADNGNVTEPVVVVLSRYEPSVLTV